MGRRQAVSEEARRIAVRVATEAARTLKGYGIVIPPLRRPPMLPMDATVVVPANGEVLFRLLRGQEPRQADFQSNQDKGRPRTDGVPHLIRCGVSMYAEPGQALIHAHRYPLAVAAVTLDIGVGISLARTYGPGHYTVWGHPEILMSQAQALAYVPD